MGRYQCSRAPEYNSRRRVWLTKELEVKSQAIKCALRNLCSVVNLRNALSALRSDRNSVQNIIWELSNHLKLVVTNCIERLCTMGVRELGIFRILYHFAKHCKWTNQASQRATELEAPALMKVGTRRCENYSELGHDQNSCT